MLVLSPVVLRPSERAVVWQGLASLPVGRTSATYAGCIIERCGTYARNDPRLKGVRIKIRILGSRANQGKPIH